MADEVDIRLVWCTEKNAYLLTAEDAQKLYRAIELIKQTRASFTDCMHTDSEN
jgi:hypothetical protein